MNRYRGWNRTSGQYGWRQASSTGAAVVWLHQGLWCKVLRRDPEHRAVLASVPGLAGARAETAAIALGVAETALAAVVVLRGQQRWVAGLQTGLVLAFNVGGLTMGRAHIARPARLLARNAAFLTLVWIPVRGRTAR